MGTTDGPPLRAQQRSRRWVLAGLAAAAAACSGWVIQETSPLNNRLAASLPGLTSAPPRLARVGYLALSKRDYPDPPAVPWVDYFRDALRDLGYVDGKNIQIEYRFADDDRDRLLQLRSDLLHLPVDVLVLADTQSLPGLKQMNPGIPIVMTVILDPVGSGLAASLREPGGDFTGIRQEEPAIHGKRLEFLQEIAPQIRHVGVVTIDGTFWGERALEETKLEAERLGLSVQPIRVRSPADIAAALEEAVQAGIDAVYRSPDPQLLLYARPLAELAMQHGLPSVGMHREEVEAGILLGYAANRGSMYSDAARLVDRILRGASPATTPIELASRFDLVVNRSTARAIGLTIPPSILLDAAGVVD